MKNPLGYQTTEYDCGPTTMINAIRYLFKREEIYPDVIKSIMLYSLDAYNDKGESGKSGTSGIAMLFLSNWLNQFGKVKKFPIDCEFLTGREVCITQNSKITVALQQGGAVVVRLMYGQWHYALLTDIKGSDIYLFDPYYRKRPFQGTDIKLITNQPEKANRKVSIERLNCTGTGYYEMGAVDTREAVILFNTDTRRTPDSSIEYFI